MKIDTIYIAGYRRDYRLTRILVASIRHWYPEIPIVIIKDCMMRDYDTTELEKTYAVSVFPCDVKLFGWGFSKLEVFFQEKKERFLLLDSDIIMAGPVLDVLEKFDEDFIVHDEPFSEKDLYQWYFNLEELQKLDPEFHFPGFTFNTGQFVGSSGILTREDFGEFIEWKEPRVMLYRNAFTFGGEQPVVNYLLMKKMTLGKLTLKRFNFMREGAHPDTDAISIENLEQKKGYPFVVHWHDKKPEVFSPHLKKVPNNRLLLHFEKKYYQRAGLNTFQHFMRIRNEYLEDKVFMSAVKTINKIKNLK
ncbi:MAG TPA: hypothetical protein VJY62_14940 [Bacteroidia bacterium]|nr:hypothetical protein [Bacteroidia bacterium]